MLFVRYIGVMAAVLLLSAGCDKPNAAPATSTASGASGPAQAQPRLPTVKLYLATKELITEMAVTPEQLQTGMMYRTNMPENEAMLFVFAKPHRAAFWMKNTLLPLSCAYIDKDGVILELHDMKPKDETSIDAATDQVQYVLEVNQGWFDRNHVAVGTLVVSEHGKLARTFSSGR